MNYVSIFTMKKVAGNIALHVMLIGKSSMFAVLRL